MTPSAQSFGLGAAGMLTVWGSDLRLYFSPVLAKFRLYGFRGFGFRGLGFPAAWTKRPYHQKPQVQPPVSAPSSCIQVRRLESAFPVSTLFGRGVRGPYP